MNIQQIKSAAGLQNTTLMFVRQFEQDKPDVPTVWVSAWDNDARVRITLHEKIADQIKVNPTFDGLAIKKVVKTATPERAEYTLYVIITPQNVEFTA